MWPNDQKYLPRKKVIYCDRCGFQHQAGEHRRKNREESKELMASGSTPSPGAGGPRSHSESRLVPSRLSVTIIGLPDGWIMLLEEGVGILSVARQGEIWDAHIYTPSYTSLPFHLQLVKGTNGILFAPLPGGGGSTDTEGR